ncbi:MAG: SpoIVB peptidase [Clostridium sp.]|nr:SpoIVB peptidase [Clostridium sp.]
MKKRVLRTISLIATPILILALVTCLSVKNVPDTIYTRDEMQVLASLKDAKAPLTDLKYNNSKININFLGILPIKSVSLKKINNVEVVPGGNSIGVKLSSEGVLVVGYSDVIINNETKESPAKKAGVEIGDIIIKSNGVKVETSRELIDSVKNAENKDLKLDIIRDGKSIEKEVELIEESEEDFKIGLWVRDSTAGVGTMTFYHKESGKFGALGHPVTDGETNKPFSIKEGELLKSSIISVKKGEKGAPGELRGIFEEEETPIGKISKNTECGIFGDGTNECSDFMCNTPIPVAFRNEIKVGKASILTTIDEDGPKEYEIEIVKLFQQDQPNPKSMIIKITDDRLLAKTGGIVQGMSGSPIIQNGKIIGAVTHVLINKPDVGYGIYIDWMLEDVGILK